MDTAGDDFEWQNVADLSIARAEHSVSKIKNNLYIFGGRMEDDMNRDSDQYGVEEQNWKFLDRSHTDGTSALSSYSTSAYST